MNIENVREFVYLAESLSYTKTAEQLFITVPTLSRHVSAMEAELGQKLFIRSPHSVQLTPAGEAIYSHFLMILDHYERALDSLAQMTEGDTGSLSLGALNYCVDRYVSPLLHAFSKQYPSIKVSARFMQPQEVINALTKNKVDVGFLMRCTFPASNRFDFHPIGSDRLVCMVDMSHPFASRESISVADLAGQTLVMLDLDTACNEAVLKVLQRYGFHLRKTAHTEQVDTAPLLLQHDGAVFVAATSLMNMAESRLRFIDFEEPDISIDICVVNRKTNPNPAIPLFVNCAQQLASR